MIIDSYPIDLCQICKHRRGCKLRLEGKDKPKDCLQNVYEGARLGHKKKNERFMGWKLHVIFDFKEMQPICAILTPGNVNDSKVALSLLKMVKRMGFNPNYIIADAAYYVRKIKKFIVTKLHAQSIIDYNPRGTIANWFEIVNKDGIEIRVTPKGTALCPAGHEMEYKGYDKEKKGSKWVCAKIFEDRHMEDGRCLFNPNHDCQIHTHVEDDYLVFNDPPMETKEWKEIHALRKKCEYFFSHFETNLNVGAKNYRQFSSLEFHVYLCLFTMISMALIAEEIGLTGWIIGIDEVRAILKRFFSGCIDDGNLGFMALDNRWEDGVSSIFKMVNLFNKKLDII